MERISIIAGNWKMNGTLDESKALATEIKGIINDEKNNDALVILFPSFISLASVAHIVKGTDINVGSQDCHSNNNGAFTGDSAANMIISAGATWTLIGHSERRQYHFENNQQLNTKLIHALTSGLNVILCIGETLEQRNNGQLWTELATQLDVATKGIICNSNNFVIAYEPIWAIGTGVTASADQAQEVHAFIRNWIQSNHSQDLANNIRILYGGSMKAENAKDLLSKPDIDGGLIGGASLNPRDFVNIIKAI